MVCVRGSIYYTVNMDLDQNMHLNIEIGSFWHLPHYYANESNYAKPQAMNFRDSPDMQLMFTEKFSFLHLFPALLWELS